jgi:hypothetical protein
VPPAGSQLTLYVLKLTGLPAALTTCSPGHAKACTLLASSSFTAGIWATEKTAMIAAYGA